VLPAAEREQAGVPLAQTRTLTWTPAAAMTRPGDDEEETGWKC